MQSGSEVILVSQSRLWAVRILSGLGMAFLLMDGVMKLFKPVRVTDAFAHLGYPQTEVIGIGILLLVCLAI